jgi:hypothetical protein
MLFWFYKNYEDKSRAQQVGKWEHLFHKSTAINFDLLEMEGIWFFKGFENSKEYSGKWKLENMGK